jgi:hypothetical protein
MTRKHQPTAQQSITPQLRPAPRRGEQAANMQNNQSGRFL